MKIECLVTNVMAVRSPERAERAMLEVIVAWHFLVNSDRFCGQGVTL